MFSCDGVGLNISIKHFNSLLTGAFLIPYFLCLAIAGIPIFFLELGIGQRLRRGSVACWNEISPYLGGIGIACMVVSFFVSVYYNMIIGWSFYYMFISMQEKLPYQSCDEYPHITKGTVYANNLRINVRYAPFCLSFSRVFAVKFFTVPFESKL